MDPHRARDEIDLRLAIDRTDLFPIEVMSAEDEVKIRALVERTTRAAVQATYQAAFDRGWRAGVEVGWQRGLSAATGDAAGILAALEHFRERRTVKEVQRDANGAILRVIETSA
jgi:hypothetical protein